MTQLDLLLETQSKVPLHSKGRQYQGGKLLQIISLAYWGLLRVE